MAEHPHLVDYSHYLSREAVELKNSALAGAALVSRAGASERISELAGRTAWWGCVKRCRSVADQG
jgi:hypothetical protein